MLGSLNSAVQRKVYQLNQMKTEVAYKEYLLNILESWHQRVSDTSSAEYHEW